MNKKKLTTILNGESMLLPSVTTAEAVRKLAEFEKLQENGNLYELPKIGEKIYFIDGWRIVESSVAYIVIKSDGAHISDYRLIDYLYGETCFLTKHDARKKLKLPQE